MSFLKKAQDRYTTKNYDSNKKIDRATIEELKEILRLSPSSINSQPWKFYFVSNELVKAELAEASLFNKNKINQASDLVVFCAIDDLNVFQEQLAAYLPESASAYFDQVMKPLPEDVVKNWMQKQVYLSLGFFLAACAHLGLDSTPMEGIVEEEYSRILNIEGYKPLFSVALGYRTEDDFNQPNLKPKSRIPQEVSIVSID